MDILLLIIGALFLIGGIIGSVVPLPGPPLSFAGILAIHFSKYAHFSDTALYTLGFATVLVTILDYYVPIWGTKKFGGSKWGSYGSAIGLLIGMFLGPFGLFIGAFIGAFIGEYLKDKNHNIAFKAAVGSFIGLMAGIIVKLILCLIMFGYAIIEVYKSF